MIYFVLNYATQVLSCKWEIAAPEYCNGKTIPMGMTQLKIIGILQCLDDINYVICF
jgi:hypothetical protein